MKIAFFFFSKARALRLLQFVILFFVQIIKKSSTAFFDLVAPPICSYCQRYLAERVIFCDDCMAQVRPIVSFLVSCGSRAPITVFAVSAYQEPIRSLIVSKRWAHRLASVQLGQLMWEKTAFKYATVDVIVPIPLHWSRRVWRGYNQAEEIAQVVARKKGCPVETLIKRVRRTRFQSHLPVEQRGGNLAGAFTLAGSANPAVYAGKHIVLVDDLMTTGATLREAARVLSVLKPASIIAVVAARAGAK